MTEQEKKLILDLSLKSISEEDFFHQFRINIDSIQSYVLEQLQKAYAGKNPDDVSYSLLLGFFFKTFSLDYENVLSKLIEEDWHYKHEDIALILQTLKSPKSVDALYNTALREFKYLGYDDTFSLARKCIHALGDINTEYAREKLQMLAQSDIPIIKEKAEKQLYYYRR